MTRLTMTETLGIPAAPEGTIDPGGVCADPVVLRLRLGIVWALQDEAAEGKSRFGRAFTDKAEARAACGRGQVVIQPHGLAGFFVHPPTTTEEAR